MSALEHYGKTCACCGETRWQFLAIHHVNGGGGKHRLELGGANQFYQWLKREGYPTGFGVLCHNCNQAKGEMTEAEFRSVQSRDRRAAE